MHTCADKELNVATHNDFMASKRDMNQNLMAWKYWISQTFSCTETSVRIIDVYVTANGVVNSYVQLAVNFLKPN